MLTTEQRENAWNAIDLLVTVSHLRHGEGEKLALHVYVRQLIAFIFFDWI
jgi:hypothetical protein